MVIIAGNAGRLISHDERHCARELRRSGTLMRHFLRAARTPSTLACRVPTRPTVASLIACPSPPQRLAPPDPRTPAHAVAVAPIANQAQAHLRAAARTAIEPVRPRLPLHRAGRVPRWTTPRNQGINTMHARTSARALEGPGFFPGMCPGLRLCGVRTEHNARTYHRLGESDQPGLPGSARITRSAHRSVHAHA